VTQNGESGPLLLSQKQREKLSPDKKNGSLINNGSSRHTETGTHCKAFLSVRLRPAGETKSWGHAFGRRVGFYTIRTFFRLPFVRQFSVDRALVGNRHYFKMTLTDTIQFSPNFIITKWNDINILSARLSILWNCNYHKIFSGNHNEWKCLHKINVCVVICEAHTHICSH